MQTDSAFARRMAGMVRASVLVTALRWDERIGVWTYGIDDGYAVAKKMLPGYLQSTPRDVVLMAIAVAENARKVETLKADGVSVGRVVTRTI